MRPITQTYYYAMYYASWFWFGLVGLLLNLGCVLLLVFPRTERLRERTRGAIRWTFDLWTRWFHACGVLRIRWIGFPKDLPRGTVYVANHPTLLDATVLLARLPNAFCIFKPALMHNPCIAPAAILGGYVAGGRDVDTIREAADKVARGQSLLVFPEGTRTARGTRLGRFRPGFALIGVRADAPIQAFVIRSSPGLVTRGRAWWAPPPMLPASLEITLGRCWPADPAYRAQDLAAEIEHYFDTSLVDPVT